MSTEQHESDHHEPEENSHHANPKGKYLALLAIVLALLGIPWIVRQPEILVALNPYFGIEFFIQNGLAGFLVLGSVFLVVTGGEALYADMGHFGRAPIRLAWFALALPALLINYFGQGALLLAISPKQWKTPSIG